MKNIYSNKQFGERIMGDRITRKLNCKKCKEYYETKLEQPNIKWIQLVEYFKNKHRYC